MAVGRIELPFLYQNRTILRWPVRRSPTTRRYFSSQSHSESLKDNHEILPSSNTGSFLKEKASRIAEEQTIPKPISSTIGTAINSTITASERRAFDTILRFSTRQPEPSGVKKQSPFVDAVDTDIENILSIFSSSVRCHQTERETVIAGQRELDAASPRPVGDQQPEPTITRKSNSAVESESISRSTNESLSKASFTTNQRQLGAPLRYVVSRDTAPEPELTSPELSFKQIASSKHFRRFDEHIQHAVRERMTEISEALQAAAASTTKRGDIAMWEVCEEQIFSLASSLKPIRRKQSSVIGPHKFTFSLLQSDNPPELLEAAEREFRDSAPVTPNTTVATRSLPETHEPLSETRFKPWTDLTILHHVYPAALLLALRLYIEHFPESQLAHNLLPRIRSLGHTSYVLGASPQFYNSLMSLVWLTRSSLREIDALLSEMERGGVELNEETYRILTRLENERAEDLTRDERHAGVLRGSRGAAWWKRHEQLFWFPRIADWLGLVKGRLLMTQANEQVAQRHAAADHEWRFSGSNVAEPSIK
ncbi:uncharacterized protein Z518_09773 [Rhinocladiella mackenziei CBS 650.93]|uniref:Rhinocladiella mackenziei CBS 650.93 unplaced genomic scaffold supercont1.8, whole genome shotgun sequence n=1 Tax=Rhinocladiella mackenziei CBS 650.93 TaxID=1442369 RepID=A0A0D2GQW6_9EURO|nr:uncharacterized protein Z518_09773 [Rhinocladiella mackenziei CBS 650.93]KIX00708.1 hypothetical protein Z518_09773 [Rhinocladiella mackenziei CBS 650.93]